MGQSLKKTKLAPVPIKIVLGWTTLVFGEEAKQLSATSWFFQPARNLSSQRERDAQIDALE